jgi:hypothetical protein
MAWIYLLKRCAYLTAICALLFVAMPVAADSLAAIPPSGDERARVAFSEFVTSWMAKLESTESQNRKNPTVQPGPSQNLVTYRGYGKGFSTELQPTGHPAAPFIGILRYKEEIYSCREVVNANCTVASTVPVTEIFRYQSGRWVY